MAGAHMALSIPPPPPTTPPPPSSSPPSSHFLTASLNEAHHRSSHSRRSINASSSSSSSPSSSSPLPLLRHHQHIRSSLSSSSWTKKNKEVLHNLLSSRFLLAWEARSHLGSSLLSIPNLQKICRRKSQHVVRASLFGVGAPEALVIGVVALLVFGPKGLAEVARTLGQSLRSFQPTIKELQQISRDFKDTLEQEIGLDELRESKPSQPPPIRNEPVEPKAYSTEDYLRVTEEQARALVPEEQRKAAEAAAWGGAPPASTEQVQTSLEVEVEVEQTQVPPTLNVKIEEKTQAEDPPVSMVETEQETQTGDPSRVAN